MTICKYLMCSVILVVGCSGGGGSGGSSGARGTLSSGSGGPSAAGTSGSSSGATAGGGSGSTSGAAGATAGSAASAGTTASAGASVGSGASASAGSSIDVSDAGAVVADCVALATNFANTCTNLVVGDARASDTQRTCMWTTYAGICKTGNAQLLFDSMKCFGDNKYCWTFSDSNSAAGCLASVHATEETATERAFLTKVCDQCGGMTCSTLPFGGLSELIPYVSDSETAALDACRGTTCSNDQLLANCSSVPDVAGIFGCK